MLRSMTKRPKSPLQNLLQSRGVYTIRELRERTGFSSQQCWNLWWGVVNVGIDTAKRLHESCGIPYEELMNLPRITPPPRQPKQSSKGKPRTPRKRNEGGTHP